MVKNIMAAIGTITVVVFIAKSYAFYLLGKQTHERNQAPSPSA